MKIIQPIYRSLTLITLISFLLFPINQLYSCETNPILASVNIVNDFNGTGTGMIDLMVSGGTGIYTYVWSNGATTQDISGLMEGQYTVTITDDDGCMAIKGPNTIDNIVGTFDNLALKSLDIFPNPTSGDLFILLGLAEEMDVSLEIWSNTGQRMAFSHQRENWNFQLNVAEFPSGVYWIRFMLDEKIITRKIVKI